MTEQNLPPTYHGQQPHGQIIPPNYGGPPTYYQGSVPPQQNAYPQHPYAPNPYPGHAFAQSQNPPVERSSGYRLSAGIVGIVLGAWLFLSFLIGVSFQQGAVLLMTLVSCFGAIAAGIVLLVQQRRRGRAAPIVMICVAGVALLFSFGSFGQFFFTFLLTTPIFIVMGIGLAREARGL